MSVELSGLIPTREASHVQDPLDSHPSGRLSPSESTLFGSAMNHCSAASEDSPCVSNSNPSIAASLTRDH